MTRQQQVQFANEFNKELEKMTVSWTNDLRDWHPIAMRALDFASALSLNIPQKHYSRLFDQETHGLNMNVVALLANNIEARTPVEMGVNAKKWNDILQLNQRIADHWEGLAKPIRETVAKRMQLMEGTGVKPIIGGLQAEA